MPRQRQKDRVTVHSHAGGREESEREYPGRPEGPGKESPGSQGQEGPTNAWKVGNEVMPRSAAAKEATWRLMRVVRYREGQGMSIPVSRDQWEM